MSSSPSTPLFRWIALAGLAGLVSASSVDAQSVWELTPYRIQVLLATASSPELTPQFHEDLGRELIAQTDALIGAAWDVRVSSALPKLRRVMLEGIDRVTLEQIPEELIRGHDCDKVLLLTIRPGPDGHLLSARDVDVRTQILNTPIHLTAWQPAKLCDVAFRAIRTAFAPLTEIVPSEEGPVRLRLRASGFPARDASYRQVAAGDLFLPVIRYNDRDGQPRRIGAVPWTFLSVDRVGQTELTCALHTGIRAALSGRRRGRVEQLAVAVIPPRRSTRLTLVSRFNPDLVLTDYDVLAVGPGSDSREVIGRTDSQGQVMIEPTDAPIRICLVMHGGLALAQLPIVPGWYAESNAAVADNDARLAAEGAAAGLELELVDLVSRREVLLIQGNAYLAAGKVDEAKALLDELQELRSRDDFDRYLRQEKGKNFSTDPTVQARIDKLFDETRKLLAKHLDATPVEQFSRKVHQALAE